MAPRVGNGNVKSTRKAQLGRHAFQTEYACVAGPAQEAWRTLKRGVSCASGWVCNVRRGSMRAKDSSMLCVLVLSQNVSNCFGAAACRTMRSDLFKREFVRSVAPALMPRARVLQKRDRRSGGSSHQTSLQSKVLRSDRGQPSPAASSATCPSPSARFVAWRPAAAASDQTSQHLPISSQASKYTKMTEIQSGAIPLALFGRAPGSNSGIWPMCRGSKQYESKLRGFVALMLSDRLRP